MHHHTKIHPSGIQLFIYLTPPYIKSTGGNCMRILQNLSRFCGESLSFPKTEFFHHRRPLIPYLKQLSRLFVVYNYPKINLYICTLYCKIS